MFKKLSFRATSLIVALVLALGSAVTAFAITILVDGDQDAVWTTGSGGQMPGHLTTNDTDEPTISQQFDIRQLYWTNDTTNFYFMLDTYGVPQLTQNPPNQRTGISFCIDTDGNTTTGGTDPNCNISGIDRIIFVDGTASVDVYSVDNSSVWTWVASGSLGYNQAASTPVIEVSVPMTSLGFVDASSCSGNKPLSAFFDNGAVDDDDNVPDTGGVNISCGSPTAITLEGMSAASGTPYLPLALAGAAFVLVAGAGLVLRKRYMA